MNHVIALLQVVTFLFVPLIFGPAAKAQDLTRVMIDMSAHNAAMPIDASVIKSDRVELIIHRLTIGRYLKNDAKNKIDDLFVRRIKEAQEHGILFGAYHVIWPSVSGKSNGKEQAESYIRALKDHCLPNQTIILAVDWEELNYVKADGSVIRGIPVPAYLRDFLVHIEKVTGKNPIIYTSVNAINAYRTQLKAEEFQTLLLKSPLWIAHYHRSYAYRTAPDKYRSGFVFPDSDDIAPWPHWTFWQFAEPKDKSPRPTNITPNRVAKHLVDLNYFDGPREVFRDFYKKHALSCEQLTALK